MTKPVLTHKIANLLKVQMYILPKRLELHEAYSAIGNSVYLTLAAEHIFWQLLLSSF